MLYYILWLYIMYINCIDRLSSDIVIVYIMRIYIHKIYIYTQTQYTIMYIWNLKTHDLLCKNISTILQYIKYSYVESYV